MSIENKGQHPSLQVLYNLATLFHISVDQFFYPDAKPDKSTRRRQFDALLDELGETDLIVLTETAKGIKQAKTEV
jgi:transcriptional regulator with XRE-family HTH domain